MSLFVITSAEKEETKNIYPNPTGDYLYIPITGDINSIQIFNISGLEFKANNGVQVREKLFIIRY